MILVKHQIRSVPGNENQPIKKKCQIINIIKQGESGKDIIQVC